MTKDDILKELYDFVLEVSLIPPKPYEQYYEEHINDSERYLKGILRTVRQMKTKLKSQTK